MKTKPYLFKSQKKVNVLLPKDASCIKGYPNEEPKPSLSLWLLCRWLLVINNVDCKPCYWFVSLLPFCNSYILGLENFAAYVASLFQYSPLISRIRSLCFLSILFTPLLNMLVLLSKYGDFCQGAYKNWFSRKLQFSNQDQCGSLK